MVSYFSLEITGTKPKTLQYILSSNVEYFGGLRDFSVLFVVNMVLCSLNLFDRC